MMLAGAAAHGARELAAAYVEILAAGERVGLAMPYWRAGEGLWRHGWANGRGVGGWRRFSSGRGF